MREIPGEEMEDGVWLDLEWFGSPERNAICPLFCIALVRSWNINIEVASMWVA
jgi:hypothetical protein